MARIQDYAIIGDCRTAALISRDGSLDWLCWPRFDSPPIFAKLLDSEVGGYWSISPRFPLRSSRAYITHSNILETHFTTDSGKATLTDLMPMLPWRFCFPTQSTGQFSERCTRIPTGYSGKAPLPSIRQARE